MPESQAEFLIATSFRLPGLGLLVVPAPPSPTWLADYALHTALSIALFIEGQQPVYSIGTVEELTHANQPIQRALLLDFAPDNLLPVGTRLKIFKA
ncbi:MAG: hypothetical protein EOO60_04790 [Hymenobacter sp.]|nr:MAG: hypothetical protein EOO60_04790 [Hymenobacter sp.]